MIIRSLFRRPSVAQSLATASATCRTTPFARNIHSVPSLTNHVELQQRGIPGLLTQKGFQEAYTDYHQHILDQLNSLTAGTPKENLEPKSLVVDWARDPANAWGFNLASMAFNNHFFFTGINSNPHVQSRPPSDLLPHINDAFSSLENLRDTFLGTAEAMFGPGFVWLVQTDDMSARSLRILPTYLAGTPLSAAHYRRQSEDLNTHNPDSYQATNSVGAFGTASRQPPKPKKPLGGTDVIPLLCVNTWEHVWLHDYGVAGKRKYLEAWWDAIDWEKVREKVTIGQAQQRGQAGNQGQRTFHYA